MTVSSIEIKKLQASEGMILTNGNAFSSVGGAVFLSAKSDIGDWFEITPAQQEQLSASGKDTNAVNFA